MRNSLPGRVCAYVFVRIRNAFEAIRNDGWQDVKALIVLGSFQLFVGFLTINALERVVGRRLIPDSKVPYMVAALVISMANYCALVFRDKWKEYEFEFTRQGRKLSRLQGIGVVLVVFAVFAVIVIAADLTGLRGSPN